MRLSPHAAAAAIGCALATALAQVPAAQQNPATTFRTGVEYVAVDVRVFDGTGEPMRGLSRDMFRVFEDGVEQQIDAFSVVDLPIARPAPAQAPAPRLVSAAPDVSSNQRTTTDGITYLILIDDQNIAAARTQATRRLVHDFVDNYLGANDIAAVMTTGRSHMLQDFTTDRSRLNAAAEKLFGDSAGSPTIQRMQGIEYKSMTSTVGGDKPIAPPAAERDKAITPARESQQFLARAAAAMSTMDARTKAILFITEGSPVQTITDAEGVSFFNENIGAQARVNSAVPIYPIDPRGLTSLADESIQIGRILPGDVPTLTLFDEITESRNRLQRLADDTGGFVTANDNLEGAFDHIARHAGFHYSIAYYPKNPRHDGKYRTINVKVSAPGATVVARRGYVAPTDRQERPVPGPAGVSPGVREALTATFPLQGVGLALTAAPFRGSGGTASVAVVNEASDFDATELEVATIAIDEHGVVKASDARKLQWPAGSPVAARVRKSGFRWLQRFNLKPGHYELRVASGAAPRRGSVFVDLDVPDFADGDLAMSGVLLSSADAFETPTYRPDPLLTDALPGPPTTSRAFASGDTIGVFSEIYDNARGGPQDVEITIAVEAANGRRVLAHSETHAAAEARKAAGVVRFRTALTMPPVAAGDYVLTVSARRPGAGQPAVARAVPFRVIGS